MLKFFISSNIKPIIAVKLHFSRNNLRLLSLIDFVCMKNPLLRILFLPSFVLLIALSGTGCKKAASTTTDETVIPVLVTNSTIINVTTTAAQSGGTITNFGLAAITANGVCYSSTNNTPTTADSKTTDPLQLQGIGNYAYSSNITGLTPNTTYYVRAYATNGVGTGYGSVVKFTTSASLTAVTSTVSTFAGNGTAGNVDGSGTGALFNNPAGLSVDSKGNVYVSDTYNNTIRKITPGGTVTTIAGTGSLGYVDGPAAAAQFYAPEGSAFDTQGNLYVADAGNNVIRKITPAGVVSTYSGNGTPGFVDGSTAANIEFNNPTGVAFDASGNLYVSDRGNNLIRKITPAGVVSSLAGVPIFPNAGYVDATDQLAEFNQPNGLVLDASNNVYVADQANSAIRKVTTPGGVVTTVAGSTTQKTLLNLPSAIAIDATGNLYLTDESGRVLEYTTGNIIYVLAGTANVSGYTDGTGANALFSNPQAIAVDASGNIYVADKNNNCIRKIVVTLTQ